MEWRNLMRLPCSPLGRGLTGRAFGVVFYCLWLCTEAEGFRPARASDGDSP